MNGQAIAEKCLCLAGNLNAVATAADQVRAASEAFGAVTIATNASTILKREHVGRLCAGLRQLRHTLDALSAHCETASLSAADLENELQTVAATLCP